MRISILVDLLRIPAHDDESTNTLAFGVSFSPAFLREPKEPKEKVPKVFDRPGNIDQSGPLIPWLWENASRSVQLWVNGTLVPDAAVLIPLTRGDVNDDDFGKLRDRIIDTCKNGTSAANNDDEWHPLVRPRPSGTDPIDVPANAFLYPTFLQSLAAQPAPIPHGKMNLVAFFRVDKSKVMPGSKVVAFPSFTVGGSRFEDIDTVTIDKGEVVGTYKTRWNSELIPSMAVEARCRPLTIADQSSPDSFLDIRSLWVRAKLPFGVDGIAPDAWFEELPVRLGVTFDLATRLVEALGKREADINIGMKWPLRDLRKSVLDEVSGNTDDAAKLTVLVVLRALHDRLGSTIPPGNPEEYFSGPSALLHRLLPRILTEPQTALLLSALPQQLSAILTDERDRAHWLPTSTTLPWADRLARRVGPLMNLPASGTEFVQELFKATLASTNPAEPFVVNRLARVVAATTAEVLANLLADVWAEAAEETADNAVKATFAELEGTDLRARLVDAMVDTRVRRCLLHPAWIASDGLFKKPQNPGDDVTDLRINAIQSLGDYGLGILTPAKSGRQCETLYDAYFVRTPLLTKRDVLRAAMESEADTSLGDLRTSLATSANTSDPNISPPAVAPGGITIQFDRVVRGQSQTAEDDDFNRSLAGYSILVRRKLPAGDAEPWRSLSLVNLGLKEDAFEPLMEDDKKTRIETLVPLTPTYDGDLPTAAVHYDNAPMVGRALIKRRTVSQPGTDPGMNPVVNPVVVPIQPLPDSTQYGTRSEAAKLPFLAFGVNLDVACFGQTNHGAIPRELTDDENPFPALLRVKDRNDLKVPEKTRNGDNIIRTVPYRRRVGVGALKLIRGSGWDPFSIPDGVRLIADELDVIGTPSANPISLEKPLERPMPRALLLHGDRVKSKAEFYLRAPSTDLEVFDRWIAFDEFKAFIERDYARQRQIRKYRNNLRDNFELAALLKEKNVSDPDATDENYSLGDPAVECLLVRAMLIFKDGKSSNQVYPISPVPWNLPLDDLLRSPTLANTHRRKMTIRLELTDSRPRKRLTIKGTRATGNEIALSIMKGEVWKLEFAAGVSETQTKPDGRFHPDLFRASPISGFLPAAPLALAVEGGMKDLPSASEVFNCFKPSVDDDGRIAFAWRRKITREAAAVGTVEVGWQQWRFTGRCSAPFPFQALGNLDQLPGSLEKPLSYPLLWEVESFADRPEEPSRSRMFQPKLLFAEGDVQLGYEVPSPKAPARYMRFQVKAENRYGPAYDPPPPTRIGEITNTAEWSTRWKRLFRSAEPNFVPSLSVRAVVPLTRSLREHSRNLGGMLLVVNGTIGETGGIAETIEVRPVRITRSLQKQDSNGYEDVSATEFATDPILRAEGRSPEVADAAVDLQLVGPLGHTFDFEAKAPAFQSSSYIVVPPPFAENDPGAGWMARLRARRVLEPRAVVGFGQERYVSDGSAASVALGPKYDVSFVLDDLGLDTPGKRLSIKFNAQRVGESDPLSEKIEIIAEARGVHGKVETVEIAFSELPKKAATTVKMIVPEPLRALRILVTRRRVEPQGLPIDVYEATLEAEGESGQLTRGGETTFEDDRATGSVELVLTAPRGCTLTVLRAPLASEWSDTGWVQFLQDTSVALRDTVNSKVDLQLIPERDALMVRSRDQSQKITWLPFLDLPDRGRKDNQGLAHFLLLTQRVGSFSGADYDEAYLGLYYLRGKLTKEAIFHRLGKDYVDVTTIDQNQLRARILIVQVDPRVWTNGVKRKSRREMLRSLNEITDEWQPFFKLEDKPGVTLSGSELAEPIAKAALLAPTDADFRILTVFASFSVHPTLAN